MGARFLWWEVLATALQMTAMAIAKHRLRGVYGREKPKRLLAIRYVLTLPQRAAGEKGRSRDEEIRRWVSRRRRRDLLCEMTESTCELTEEEHMVSGELREERIYVRKATWNRHDHDGISR
jgi:hypothetical protein